jgi:hypothetical protein
MQSHEDILQLRAGKCQFMIDFPKLNSLKLSLVPLYGGWLKGINCLNSVKLSFLVFEEDKRILLLFGDIFS